MSDLRMDLIEHFVDADGMRASAAAKRADTALRIDTTEWRSAMTWLRRDFRRQERFERKVLPAAVAQEAAPAP